ncbi:MAG: winged helix-turn-helix domain-containing protein [bacterium]
MVAKQSNLPKSQPAESSVDLSPTKHVFNLVRGMATDRTKSRFDRLIHDRMRLAIVSALAGNEKLTFTDLKQLLAATDGNLSVHARKLEDAGYITVSKFFEGRVPKTEYRLTAEGKKALDAYLNHMEDLIRAMRNQ